MSRRTFQRLFFKNLYFLENFWTSCHKCSAGLSKLHSTRLEDHFDKFFLKNLNFQLFLDCGQNILGLLAKTSWHSFQNCILLAQNILKRDFFENFQFCYFGTFGEKFSAWLSKMHSTRPEEHFAKIFF